MSESRASTWLVTGPGGVVTGLLGLERLRAVRGEARRTTRIGELAQPIDAAPTVFADEQVIDVLKRFEGRDARAVVRERWTADPAERDAIAGLLTPEDVSRAIEVGRMANGGDTRTSSPDRGTSEGPVWP